MIQIRSNLKGPIELSPKTGPVKFERSKNNNKPEFLNEISESEYRSLLEDSSGVFKTLIKNGDLQVIQDEDEKVVESVPVDVKSLILQGVEEYKKGEGAELLQSSLDKLKKELEADHDKRYSEGLAEVGKAWDTESKTKKSEAVKFAVDEVKKGLVVKHNSEKKKGKLINW